MRTPTIPHDQDPILQRSRAQTDLQHRQTLIPPPAPPPLQVDRATGLYFRPDTYDQQIIHERRTYEALGIQPQDRVLDVGACLGSFAYLAAHTYSAAHVFSFEPDPDNYTLLDLNIRERFPPAAAANVLSYPYALVPGASTDAFHPVPLYRNVGMNKGMHSLISRRGRPSIQVWGFSFQRALDLISPTALKVDVEGGEYDLLRWPLPPSVTKLAVELHRNRSSWRTHAQQHLTHYIESQGFTPTKPPRDAGWATLGIWRR